MGCIIFQFPSNLSQKFEDQVTLEFKSVVNDYIPEGLEDQCQMERNTRIKLGRQHG